MDSVITKEWIQNLLEYLKQQKKVHKKFIWIILKRVITLLDSYKNVPAISFDDHPRVTVCGDVHG